MGKNLKTHKKKRANLKGVFLFSFLLLCLLLFLTQSSFFKVKKVEIVGKNLTLQESLQKKGDKFLEENIFFVKSKDVLNEFKENPYVNGVELERKFPSTLIVNVEEGDIAFYIGKGKNAYILSSNLRVLEKNINGNLNGDIKNLVEVTGLDIKDIQIGSSLVDSEDNVAEKVCKEIYEIKKVNKTNHKITRVDFSNLSKIKIWIGRVEVRVGDGTDFISKVNKALNILEDKKLNMQNGYIDLSFEGSPIIKREIKESK